MVMGELSRSKGHADVQFGSTGKSLMFLMHLLRILPTAGSPLLVARASQPNCRHLPLEQGSNEGIATSNHVTKVDSSLHAANNNSNSSMHAHAQTCARGGGTK